MPEAQGPLVCAVIGRTRHKMMLIEIQEAAKQGAQLIELRLDFLSKAPDFKRLIVERPCPLIATFRRPIDGGRWAHSDEERMMLIRQAIVAGFDYIDLETEIASQVPRFGKVKRIVSYHNLRETPDDLPAIYAAMCKQDPDIVKIAVTAQTTNDNLRIFDILQNSPCPTVALCMGDLGTCSRVMGLRFGMPFTYGAFNKERGIAPGILSFQELKKLYRAEQISETTKVFGVIGDPVGHSLSPLIHNAAFKKLGIDAVYVPFRVPHGELPAFVKGFRSVPVSGYSVTIPHKEAAARVAEHKDEAVLTMGAANTLLESAKGILAFNTDAEAALQSLQANLPLDTEGMPAALATRTVMILGAGGVARAIAHALSKTKIPLVIANRTEARAHQLAAEVGCKYVDWATRHNVVCDTVINCTSVGMHPNLDASPLHHSYLKPGLMVFDTIYTPESTMLVREARGRGCHVLTGVDMFVRQAALQFKLFTGKDAPLEMMTNLVRRALSPLQPKDDDEEKPA